MEDLSQATETKGLRCSFVLLLCGCVTSPGWAKTFQDSYSGLSCVTTIFHKGPVNMDNNKMWRMWFMSKSFCTILCWNTQTRKGCCICSSVPYSCLFAAVGVCRVVFILLVCRGQGSISLALNIRQFIIRFITLLGKKKCSLVHMTLCL